MLLASLLASSLAVSNAIAQIAPGSKGPTEARPAVSSGVVSSNGPLPVSVPGIPRSSRQAMMYRRIWGVDDIKVEQTASGELIRFNYRVVDAIHAQPLNDKKETPYLIDMKTGIRLQVPQTEKVGQLRQVATPVNGREYFMVFFNQNRVVKRGDRVSVVIGKFRIDALVVE